MRIKCLHGYFIFDETGPAELSKFMSRYGFELAPKDNYFTFDFLKTAPEYSLVGVPYLGAVTSSLYEGKPWEVMRENDLVYNFSLGLVVPIASITQLIEITETANYFLSPGLILPGSVTDDGFRVKEYTAWFSFDNLTFKYSEISSE